MSMNKKKKKEENYNKIDIKKKKTIMIHMLLERMTSLGFPLYESHWFDNFVW